MRFPWPLAVILLAAPVTRAATPDEMLRDYAAAAHAGAPSPAVGRQFFASRHGGDWSCSSCHTNDPTATGRHVVTGKAIAPLAPAANPQRFRDTARVEKWFRRNCNDTLRRECTAAEKANVLAYLLTLQKGA